MAKLAYFNNDLDPVNLIQKNLTWMCWSFYVNQFKGCSLNGQTDRQTGTHTHTHTHTYTHTHSDNIFSTIYGNKNVFHLKAFKSTLTSLTEFINWNLDMNTQFSKLIAPFRFNWGFGPQNISITTSIHQPSGVIYFWNWVFVPKQLKHKYLKTLSAMDWFLYNSLKHQSLTCE